MHFSDHWFGSNSTSGLILPRHLEHSRRFGGYLCSSGVCFRVRLISILLLIKKMKCFSIWINCNFLKSFLLWQQWKRRCWQELEHDQVVASVARVASFKDNQSSAQAQSGLRLRGQLAQERLQHSHRLHAFQLHLCRHRRAVVQGQVLLLHRPIQAHQKRVPVRDWFHSKTDRNETKWLFLICLIVLRLLEAVNSSAIPKIRTSQR